MPATPVIAIYDIGRTHKKFLLFDASYKVVFESSSKFEDTMDEDGFPCEDLAAIESWMLQSLQEALKNPDVDIQAVNFSGHGASMVHLGEQGKPVTPLYDYMKPLDEKIADGYYGLFGGRAAFSQETGSPALNMLNSSTQLYWLQHAHPEKFSLIRKSLHLPQYGNYLFSRKAHADISSIGCHTGLWDFQKQDYHHWLEQQDYRRLLPDAEPVKMADIVSFNGKEIPVGIGLHDSSAALLPFVYTAKEPFLLLSTGTWNISLHPYFNSTLNADDYTKDCLYYLLDAKQPVAASRLFLGSEYQHQVKALESYFQKQPGYYLSVLPDAKLFKEALDLQSVETTFYPQTMKGTGPFPDLEGRMPDLSLFKDFDQAYHKLMLDLTYLQKVSLELLMDRSPVNRIYVSGGFVQSDVFMELLQSFLPGKDIFIAENKRGSAMGAALAIHDSWQKGPISEQVAALVKFKPALSVDLSGYQSCFEQLSHS